MNKSKGPSPINVRLSVKRILLYLTLCLLDGCSTQEDKCVTVLQYSDFGPQVIASEVIGMEWWQWQVYRASRPIKTDVKVVVYKGIPLSNIEKSYPVIPQRQEDFRYLELQSALLFLDGKIEENLMETVTTTLVRTREQISMMSGCSVLK